MQLETYVLISRTFQYACSEPLYTVATESLISHRVLRFSFSFHHKQVRNQATGIRLALGCLKVFYMIL